MSLDRPLFLRAILSYLLQFFGLVFGEYYSFARTSARENQAVRNAIHDILGFKIAKQTLSDLAEIKSEYNREIGRRNHGTKIGELYDTLSRLELAKKTCEDKIETTEHEIEEANFRYLQADIALKNSNAEVIQQNQNDRSRLKKQIESIEASIINERKHQRKLLGDNLSAIFATKLASQALDFINEEEFKGTIPAPYNENLVRDILDQAKCICGAEIHEGTQAYDNIHKLLAKAADPLQGDRVTRGRETLKAIQVRNESALNLLDKNKADIAEKENSLEDLKARIAVIDLRIGDYDSEEIKKLEKDYQYYFQALQAENKNLGKFQTELTKLDSDIEKIQREIDSLKNLSTGIEEIQESLQILAKVEDLIKITLDKAEKGALEYLPRLINETLKKYVRQDYRAKLSKDSYNIQLIDSSNRPVAESDGQQLLLSLTFISSLINLASDRKKASGEILMPGAIAPFVIDAPFGVLDNAYKGNMARYIPESVEQVIFLLSSSHWEGTVEENIRERIGREYNLVSEVSSDQGDKELSPINILGKTFDTARYNCEKDRTVIEEVKL